MQDHLDVLEMIEIDLHDGGLLLRLVADVRLLLRLLVVFVVVVVIVVVLGVLYSVILCRKQTAGRREEELIKTRPVNNKEK
jgi:hypothetical protein